LAVPLQLGIALVAIPLGVFSPPDLAKTCLRELMLQ